MAIGRIEAQKAFEMKKHDLVAQALVLDLQKEKKRWQMLGFPISISEHSLGRKQLNTDDVAWWHVDFRTLPVMSSELRQHSFHDYGGKMIFRIEVVHK